MLPDTVKHQKDSQNDNDPDSTYLKIRVTVFILNRAPYGLALSFVAKAIHFSNEVAQKGTGQLNSLIHTCFRPYSLSTTIQLPAHSIYYVEVKGEMMVEKRTVSICSYTSGWMNCDQCVEKSN